MNKVKVEIKVEDIVSELTAREQDELAFNIFDNLPDADKAGHVQDCFASLDDKSQRSVLDYIIAELLTDEQFHILTQYFKKYGNEVIKINEPDDMCQVFKHGQEIEIEGIRLRYDKHNGCSHCALNDFDSDYCTNARCDVGIGGAFIYAK